MFSFNFGDLGMGMRSMRGYIIMQVAACIEHAQYKLQAVMVCFVFQFYVQLHYYYLSFV